MLKIGKNLHQSWGVVALSVGIILGAILGIIFRINYFGSPIWIVLVVLIFVFMYFRPNYLTVGLCLIVGMVLVFFRVAMVLSNDTGTQNQEMSGTESLVISARDFLAERIENQLPEREAKLGMSYLLGMKSGLDKKLSEDLKTVGLTHIVVASGAHLSILVEIARKIFGRLSRFSGLLFSVLFILFFMCMVGWTPSILRAGVMAILTLTSWYVGRKIAPLRLILIVMAFTLMLNPMFLTSLGWLLSFASYAGIMLLGPSISKFFHGDKKPGFIASVILTTIAATLMTLPITLYYFGQVSIISLVANLVILPTLPYAMGLTFFAGIFAGVPAVEMVFSFLAEKILSFHIATVEFFGSMEQFLIKIEPYNPWVFLLYLIILAPFLYKFFRWTIDRKNGKIKISKNINFLE
ncbi:MAG: ComEC/Rec2 family competence protein [Candidatus Saccharibacteria bacterium]|nr:ComEC/Rec2 family competence protein [Candidatus Saccharibacteria bacterium]